MGCTPIKKQQSNHFQSNVQEKKIENIQLITQESQNPKVINQINPIKNKILKEQKELDQICQNINQLNLSQFQNSTYQGQIQGNQKHGEGEYIQYSDELNQIIDYYLGEWKDDKRNGLGLMISFKGEQYDYYVGNFQNDKKHGSGFIEFSNGETYKGNFQNDLFEGQGKYTLKDKQTFYDGNWIQNQRNGKGIEQGNDGKIKWNFEGQFLNNMRQGKGKLILEENCEITGEFENNFPKNAQIIYFDQKFKEHQSYIGDLGINNDGQMIFEGKGKLTYRDNSSIEGQFKEHQYQESNQVIQAN